MSKNPPQSPAVRAIVSSGWGNPILGVNFYCMAEEDVKIGEQTLYRFSGIVPSETAQEMLTWCEGVDAGMSLKLSGAGPRVDLFTLDKSLATYIKLKWGRKQ